MTISAALDCVFCREIQGRRDTNFAVRYPELMTRMVGQTDSLVAFPCIGQLTPCHFLVVPKRHYCTFADASRSCGNLVDEFQQLVMDVHALLDCDPGSSLLFEHGASKASEGGCGIYHAHVHVVPAAGHVDLGTCDASTGSREFAEFSDIWAAMEPGRPYLAYGSHTHGYAGNRLQQPLPSQYLRRAVANALGEPNWDWRGYEREAGLLRILAEAPDSTKYFARQ